jgi:5-methylcytosine-specific restriction endonuclease McrA
MVRILCLEAGCPNDATSRGRCDDHRKAIERDRSRRRRADPDRGKAVKVYHSAKWLNTRKYVLARQPLCICGKLAQEIDHIIPLSEDGAPYALENLQPMCPGCHRDKHRGDGRVVT